MIVDAAFSKSMANLVYFQHEEREARQEKRNLCGLRGSFSDFEKPCDD